MRRTDREITDIGEIIGIIESAGVLRLGLFSDEYPYVVPMHFGYEYADGVFTFYVHCAREGRKLDLIDRDPRVCIELEGGTRLISGGDVPCEWGAEYSCVMGFGTAVRLTDTGEKIKGLSLLMKHQTGREFEITPGMTKAVEVIAVRIGSISAKARKVQ
ncbi:MAG: pyridoxamine 5'-phosphate oxidase family protein [Eubacteriaceae bacterium]|nr:pyridoxamine 5'-phosphate oxidase family protein [Eubacteriaceae bacterium]